MMVRLHTSLLALAIAMGLVLASSDDYERRDDELFERDLDVDEFFGRQYDLLDERIFDEPEARGFFGGPFKEPEHHTGRPAVRLGKKMKPSDWSKRKTMHSAKRIVRQLRRTR